MLQVRKLVLLIAWPELPGSVFHPDDLPLARKRIPGQRVYEFNSRASSEEPGKPSPYYELRHGEEVIRAKGLLWRELPDGGLRVGDWVEVKSLWGKNDPFVGQIAEMFWDDYAECIRYQIQKTEMVDPKAFAAHELTLLDQWDPDPETRLTGRSSHIHRVQPPPDSDVPEFGLQPPGF